MSPEDRKHLDGAVNFLHKIKKQAFFKFGQIEDNGDDYGLYSLTQDQFGKKKSVFFKTSFINTQDFVLFLQNFNKKQHKIHKVPFSFDGNDIIIGRKDQNQKLLAAMATISKQFVEQGVFEKVVGTNPTRTKNVNKNKLN